ncbi:cell surface A33 antigen [Varanus komodoensis]|uniref:cell surface A33 antigen n=1 Tax=Varanus komodoensis TaxID=61221 RepID=UPI001CF794ED|nr:cell surface A33 antigen [Varanus komodoensis]
MTSEVVAAVHALTVEAPEKIVRAEKTKNATLPCTFKSTTVNRQPGDIISWVKRANEHVEIANKRLDNGEVGKDQNYAGRLSFPGDANRGDASIIISQLTMDDNGTYSCSVRISAESTLKIADMELLVLVPPSNPECKIIGKLEYGENINLTCNSAEGSPKPTYSWTSYDAQNQPRKHMGTEIAGGMLLLKNISADTTGYFVCLASNSAGQRNCNMSVAVQPPSMNFALFGGIIGGSVALIIIISIGVYCCCCRDSKNNQYEQTETENNYHSQEPVRIRGPREEEDYNTGKYSPQMTPELRPPAKLSTNAVI